MTKIYESYKNESSPDPETIIITDDIKQNNFITLNDNKNRNKIVDISVVSRTTIKITDTWLGKERVVIGSKTSGNLPEPEFTFDNYTSTLLNMMQNEEFEAGFSTESEIFVKSLLDQNRLLTMEWLGNIFMDYSYDVKILVGILHILSHFDYEEVTSQGACIAMSGSRHRSSEVKDFAIKAFENWGSIKTLTFLKNIHCEEVWLQKYIDKIIRQLERS